MRSLPMIVFRSSLALVAVLLLAGSSREQEPGPRDAGKPTAADAPVDPTLAELLAAHNRYRESEKKPPLKLNARLIEAARVQARDMAEHNKMAHEGSDGSTPKVRIQRAGYHYQSIGENVAEGQETVAGALRSWIESPPHRENILGDFTEMGGAVAKGSDGETYWCVDFGRPMPEVHPEKGPDELIVALNRARTSARKKTLKSDPRLAQVAAHFARDAADRKSLQVKDRDGKTPFDLLKAGGYRARRFGTTLASGEGEPEKVVARWLGDPREREALLSGFEQVGVGVAADSEGVPYWVILLAQGVGR